MALENVRNAAEGFYADVSSNPREDTSSMFKDGSTWFKEADVLAADTFPERTIFALHNGQQLKEILLTADVDVVADAVNYADIAFAYYDGVVAFPVALGTFSTSTQSLTAHIPVSVMDIVGISKIALPARASIVYSVNKAGAGVALPEYQIKVVTDMQNI